MPLGGMSDRLSANRKRAISSLSFRYAAIAVVVHGRDAFVESRRAPQQWPSPPAPRLSIDTGHDDPKGRVSLAITSLAASRQPAPAAICTDRGRAAPALRPWEYR